MKQIEKQEREIEIIVEENKDFVKCDFCDKGIISLKEWENEEIPIGFIEIIEQDTNSSKNTLYNFCNKECLNNWRETIEMGKIK